MTTDKEKKVFIKRGKNSVIQEGKSLPQCEAKVKTYGNIWTRELKLKKGQAKAGHKHQFDHLHFLSKGQVKIRVYDQADKEEIIFEGTYTAPAWIKVPKEHFHDIIALKASLGYCIQAITNPEGNVIKTDYANDPDWMSEVNQYEKDNGLLDETSKD